MMAVENDTQSDADVGRRGPMFSLVLATYGRSDVLAPMIASLAGQTFRDFEVIVSDQNADDRVVPFLAPLLAAGIPVRRFKLPSPNLSLARNFGITRAAGRIVGFPDDDCWYEPDCLEAIATAAATRPQVAGWVARWVEAEPGEGRPAHRLDHQVFRNFRGGDASSITLFIATDVLQRLDGFDPRIGVGRYYGAGEETDLVFRILEQGSAMEHLPTARVHHRFDTSVPILDRRALQAKRARERGVGAMYAKHGLSPFVIARGVMAPVFLPLASDSPLKGVCLGMATMAGRIEGFVRWKLTERFEHQHLVAAPQTVCKGQD